MIAPDVPYPLPQRPVPVFAQDRSRTAAANSPSRERSFGAALQNARKAPELSQRPETSDDDPESSSSGANTDGSTRVDGEPAIAQSKSENPDDAKTGLQDGGAKATAVLLTTDSSLTTGNLALAAAASQIGSQVALPAGGSGAKTAAAQTTASSVPPSIVPAQAGSVQTVDTNIDKSGVPMDSSLAKPTGPGVSSATILAAPGAKAGVSNSERLSVPQAEATTPSSITARANAAKLTASGRIPLGATSGQAATEAGPHAGDGVQPALANGRMEVESNAALGTLSGSVTEGGPGVPSSPSLSLTNSVTNSVDDGGQAIVRQEPAALQSQGQTVTAAGQPAEAHGIVSVKLQGLAPLAAAQAAQGAKPPASSGKGGQLEPIAPGTYIALAAGAEASGASGTESGRSGDGQSAEEKEARPGGQTQENSAPSPPDAQATRALVSETTAASSASSASNVSASVERAHLAQQLAKHIDTMRLANAGHSEMSLDLNQEHLGGLRLTVSSDANGVSARIVVETAQAQQAVDAAKDQLRAALENRGLSLASLDVSLGQSSSGGNSFAREHSSQAETGRQPTWRPDVSSTVSPLQAITLPRATPVRASRERLDYRA